MTSTGGGDGGKLAACYDDLAWQSGNLRHAPLEPIAARDRAAMLLLTVMLVPSIARRREKTFYGWIPGGPHLFLTQGRDQEDV
jgi:hypothetical protein